jgi:hypothetical protein
MTLSDLGDRRLFMAGYLGYVTNWEEFAAKWEEALAASPAIQYLKMSEAIGLRGQFQDWEERARDIKLKRLAAVIQHTGVISFHCSIDREKFKASVPLTPRGFNPYFCCCVGTFSMLANFMAKNGGMPIEFTFDRQDGVSDDVPFFFEQIRECFAEEVQRLLVNPPSFKNDLTVVALQAADMLASEIRRTFEEKEYGARHLKVPSVMKETHVYGELPEKMLEGWGKQFAAFEGIDKMQTKREWRRLKEHAGKAVAAGYVPPYGTRWRNIWVPMALRVRRFLRR